MRQLLSGFAICSVAVFFVIFNIYFSVNFPFQDDFLIIQFIETATQHQLGFVGFIDELFRTFNDHKAVTIRFLAWAEYGITGHVNFKFYIVLVSFLITYIFSFLYIQFKKTGLPLYYFLPAAFLFFQPLYHEISGWALNGMQHSFLTAFTVTAVILVSRGTRLAFSGAILCCFLATFTHGNGILSFPAIVFYFLCSMDFKKAAFTTASMVVCLIVYLAGYESGQAVRLPANAVTFIASFFGFIGSAVAVWGNHEFWSALWGIVITAFMGWLVIKVVRSHFDKNLTLKPGTLELLTLFAFILISSFLIALFRSWAGNTIASRFQLYASLSSVIFYLLLIDYFPVFRKKYFFLLISGLSVFYGVYSYYKFTGIAAIKKTTYLADVYNWKTNQNMFSVERAITRNGSFYLLPAYKKGIFRLPESIVDKPQLDSMYLAGAGEASSGIYIEDSKMTRATKDGTEQLNHVFVSSNAFPKQRGLLNDRFLVLKNKDDGKIFLLAANPKVASRKKILTEGVYYNDGFNAFLRSDDLDPGRYDLAILDLKNDGSKIFQRLDKSLNASGGRYKLE